MDKVRAWLVTGDRNWTDRERIYGAMDKLFKRYQFSFLVEGACVSGKHKDETGRPINADLIAEDWAREREIIYLGVPAQWATVGRAAGPARNLLMLKLVERLGLCLIGAAAFHDSLEWSKGTRDMVKLLKREGVATIHITKETAEWLTENRPS